MTSVLNIRFESSPKETAAMSTQELRNNFLVQNLMQPGKINMTYTHYDRMIIGGAMPTPHTRIELPNDPELRAEYFLERREMGIINVGDDGVIIADDQIYHLRKLDCIYLPKGIKKVEFDAEVGQPVFYFLSAPAHHHYDVTVVKREDAQPVTIGSPDTCNERTIYKYIHLEGARSCQLVMGLTVLAKGSVWNTMPAHTHTRRSEVYFYFDVADDQRVVHIMGEPKESRHIIIANNEAVISPCWSMHCGCGTANYGFIWGMCGENLVYTDMDPAPIGSIL